MSSSHKSQQGPLLKLQKGYKSLPEPLSVVKHGMEKTLKSFSHPSIYPSVLQTSWQGPNDASGIPQALGRDGDHRLRHLQLAKAL